MQEKWNVLDRWYVSPYSYADEVRANYDLPERITIRDVTLSEGQHQPGVNYTLAGMLKIAHALHEIGITEVKQHADDFQTLEFIKLLKAELPDVKVSLVIEVHHAYLRSSSEWRKGLDRYIDAGIDEVVLPGQVSWSCPKSISDQMPKEVRLAGYAEAAQYAREKGIEVEFGHVDFTRASLDDLKDFLNTGFNAGMTRIGIYDSYGVATPDAMKYLVRWLKKGYKGIPILVHAHNDLGSAAATTIGGILGGASCCDLSLNGLGDRAGNAALEEVVLQLETSYGVKTGVKLEHLLRVCRLVEQITGITLHNFKPIAGKNAFAHESEAHAKMILEYGISAKYAAKAEGYSPEIVGGKRNIRFGGTSLTGGMIRLRMNQIGLKYSNKEVEKVIKRIEDIFVTKRTDISLEEFDKLAKEVCSDRTEKNL